MSKAQTLVHVDDLHVWFGSAARPVRAVDGVSFDIAAGETVGLVGESGSGKSVTALSLARLIPPSEQVRCSGGMVFNGEDVMRMGRRRLSRLRGGEIAYVFQEPSVALNPVLTVGRQIMEAIKLHRPEISARDEAGKLLDKVGIGGGAACLGAYPFELSGGMQQRVMLAMALACRPRLLVADEPTTALDVTIQAQILELLAALQKEFQMALLLITHNLGLVAEVTHRLNVMYAGRIVESGPTEDVLRVPAHPYTRGLLAAVPRLHDARRELRGIEGAVPDAANLPPGCKFEPRCPLAAEVCRADEPGLVRLEGSAGERLARCYFASVAGTYEREPRQRTGQPLRA